MILRPAASPVRLAARAAVVLLACAGLVIIAAPASAAITREVISTSLVQPLHVTAPPGDNTRLFVAERNGLVRIIDKATYAVSPTAFLNIAPRIFLVGEGGLLAIAFHSDYATNGFFFVSYTADIDPGPGTQLGSRVSRFQVSANPDIADALSETVFLEVAQPATNHNGGMIAFRPGDPDRWLYIALGDGGNQCDPTGRGQDTTDKLASILRIDVDSGPSGDPANPFVPPDNPFVGVPGDDAVWVYGLRNPYRFSFDRHTADLYIADVGGDAREEIDFQPAGSAGGENYGWSAIEGTVSPPQNCSGTPPVMPGMVPPIHEYAHGGGGASIIGGHVYRGTASPALTGRYFFADFITGQVWSCRRLGADMFDLQDHTDELNPALGNVTSFGEDAVGELYMMDFSGTLVRIQDDNPILPDFDQDLLPDEYETNTGTFTSATDTGSSPIDPDSDDDGVLDGIEVQLGTDPNNPLDFPLLPIQRDWIPVAMLAMSLVVASTWFVRRRPRLR